MEASAGDLKGYDHEFVEPPPDDLLCLICLCVARDPQQINCCGKVLCNGCLREHRKSFSICPQCRKPINSFADKRSERDILSLEIRCDNYSNGCKWVGELRSLAEHLAICGFTLLPCPNKCHKGGKVPSVVQLLRQDLEKHAKKECPRRQYECPHCQEAGEYQERTTTHLDECRMIEVPCPKRKCKRLIPRCSLSDHRQECMFERVRCKYATIGCKKEVERKDLVEHERDTQQHLQLAIDTVHQQQITIREQNSMLVHLWSKEVTTKYKFTKYDQHKAASDIIQSSPFYTSPGGYKMCITVYANGYGEGKDTHVSVFAHLMKGENDDNLSWPFIGTVTIELLNQLEDENHHSTRIVFKRDDKASQRVVSTEIFNSGWGRRLYIKHSDLDLNATRNCQYLKDDCLYFRISVEAESSSKPWLV